MKTSKQKFEFFSDEIGYDSRNNPNSERTRGFSLVQRLNHSSKMRNAVRAAMKI